MEKGTLESQPEAGQPSPSADRLDSWKEIASYLKREIRTVQRWEKTEGLPVHRHLHSQRGSVYARRAELDAWWSSRESRLEQQEQARAGMRRRLLWRVAGAAVVVVGLIAVGYFLRQRFWPSAPTGRVMLAVLPLENLSGNPEQEYFSDGLTEEMITQLGRLHPERLGVIARTSTMHYKGTKKRVDEIGRELKVDYILEGSVRREAEWVRISAQLIRVSDQTHLWAESYQRDVRDILALQSDIAGAIAREVSVTLTPQVQTRLAGSRPVDPEAYDLYLKGRFFWNKRSEEGLKKAIDYFRQAIESGPPYAQTYAGLADSYLVLGIHTSARPREIYPKAQAAARKALEIDDALAEAHTSLAYAKDLYDWDWAGAEKEFKRAMELNPNYANAHHWYALHLAYLGRVEEAIAEMKRAQELDPLSLIINTNLGRMLSFTRDYDRGVEQYRKTLEIDPNFIHAHYSLGLAYEQKGMHEEAVAEFQKAVTLSGDNAARLGALGHAYALAGRKGEALEILRALKERSRRSYVDPIFLTLVHLGLDEKEQALEELERAYVERSLTQVFLKADPRFDRLRSDPRFQDLLHRMNFPD